VFGFLIDRFDVQVAFFAVAAVAALATALTAAIVFRLQDAPAPNPSPASSTDAGELPPTLPAIPEDFRQKQHWTASETYFGNSADIWREIRNPVRPYRTDYLAENSS